jgi:DNA polymerase II small subunit/DNA polymerase delta subunit B
MLEDESGRIRLVGERLKDSGLVTGVIIGVLGAETPNGDFEVVDLCYPELARQHAASEMLNGRNSPKAKGKSYLSTRFSANHTFS